MIRFAERRLALVAAAIAVVVLTAPASARQATFRASTESTWITATVIDKDGRLVTNVRQDEFQVFENGQPRPITTFRNDTVPFSIAITLDTSLSMFENLGWVRRGIDELVSRFEPGDRANIGTFAGIPRISPHFSGSRTTLLSWVSATIGGGAVPCEREMDVNSMMKNSLSYTEGTAVWDALACAIETVAGDSETPRRVALIVTDGMDHMSSVRPTEALALANTYGVMVYAITTVGVEGMDAGALRGIADETGGGFFTLHSAMDMPSIFAKLADELRHQYVFGFSSSDPKSKIEVRTSRPDTTVRSRRTSLIVRSSVAAATSAKTPATSPAPAAPAATTPLAAPAASAPSSRPAGTLPFVIDLVDEYSRGDWSTAQAPLLSEGSLANVARNLKRDAGDWIRADGPLNEQRRRLAFATFILEFLERQDDGRYWQYGQTAADLLEWTCAELREGPATNAERDWDIAAFALLERFHALITLHQHIDHAESRFPSDPKWVLQRGILAELETWPQERGTRLDAATAGITVPIVNRLGDAAKIGSVATEALLRLGFFELRRGKPDAAIARFDTAGRSDDAQVRYLIHLLRGRALEQVKRRDEAIAEYRQALTDFPLAQSATLSLGEALTANGHTDEAAALTFELLSIRTPRFDPWTLYAVPDWRFWTDIITDLRKAVHQ